MLSEDKDADKTETNIFLNQNIFQIHIRYCSRFSETSANNLTVTCLDREFDDLV